MEPVEIRTDRLLLRAWEAKDAAAVLDACSDPTSTTPRRSAAEKAGFSREGVSRRSRPDRTGEARDMVLFALVR